MLRLLIWLGIAQGSRYSPAALVRALDLVTDMEAFESAACHLSRAEDAHGIIELLAIGSRSWDNESRPAIVIHGAFQTWFACALVSVVRGCAASGGPVRAACEDGVATQYQGGKYQVSRRHDTLLLMQTHGIQLCCGSMTDAIICSSSRSDHAFALVVVNSTLASAVVLSVEPTLPIGAVIVIVTAYNKAYHVTYYENPQIT